MLNNIKFANIDLYQLLSDKKNFVQRIFKALFIKKTNCAIRAEATPVGRSKTFLHQKLRIVICNNFCQKKIFCTMHL